MPEVERAVPVIENRPRILGGSRMRVNAWLGRSRSRSLFDRDSMAAPTAGVSGVNRLPAKSAASTERTLLWAFIAGLAWCPFWFGGSVLLAWGINVVLFPGLVVIYVVTGFSTVSTKFSGSRCSAVNSR
jgi:hypothetical protein